MDLPLLLDRSHAVPLHLAVYAALRDAMLQGRLGPGTRLPATRDLARQLGVARGTVVAAYELLAGEGYVHGAHGAGTLVAPSLPEGWPRPEGARAFAHRPRTVTLSTRGRQLARTPFPMGALGPPRPFRPSTPSIDAFPRARWAQLFARHARKTNGDRFREVDPQGFLPLRRVLAEHLRASRGVRCDAAQIVIVPTVHAALDLSARLLLDAGDAAWLEDPGYFGARKVLEAAAIDVVPVPVDEQGLAFDAAPPAKLAFVTPARQTPLGVTLSLERRLSLLAHAATSDMWIFEDDYDSEFRYEGRPLPALQSLDAHDVVLHAGTFGKSLFPGLRVAYLVVPESLTDAFTSALATIHRFVPLLPQAALADFIAEGDLGRHFRRMRRLYGARRESLLDALSKELGDQVTVAGTESGLEVLALLPRGMSDRAVGQRAGALGLELFPLSKYAINPPRRGGLVLGFAAVSEERTRKAVKTLASALDD